jgi:DNA-directed RNA polymerase subunit E'
MDDYINYDAKLPGFIGKKTDKKLVPEDNVLARIVTVSLKGDTSSSKVGLTMRQPFLGKADWAKIDEKAVKEGKGKKGKKEAEEKPKKEIKGKEEKEKKE